MNPLANATMATANHVPRLNPNKIEQMIRPKARIPPRNRNIRMKEKSKRPMNTNPVKPPKVTRVVMAADSIT